MQPLHTINRDHAVTILDQGKGPRENTPHKRLSQKEERVEEFLKRLDVKLKRIDRGFV
jgi:hypothetical protein